MIKATRTLLIVSVLIGSTVGALAQNSDNVAMPAPADFVQGGWSFAPLNPTGYEADSCPDSVESVSIIHARGGLNAERIYAFCAMSASGSGEVILRKLNDCKTTWSVPANACRVIKITSFRSMLGHKKGDIDMLYFRQYGN